MEAAYGGSLGPDERGGAREVSDGDARARALGLRVESGDSGGGNEVNLDCVDLGRVEDLSSIAGVDGMDLDAMSLEELLYFALLGRVKVRLGSDD